MTFYKYAERKVADQMDWSVVGKDINSTLAEEAKLREQKKAEIEKASRDTLDILANAPQGEHKSMNEWALKGSGTYTESMLMLNRQLKAGTIKPNDYIIKAQSLKDGATNTMDIIKEYQTEYKRKMDMYQKGDKSIGAKTVYEMTLLEGLSNFEKSDIYVDPTTYKTYIANKKFNEKTGMYEISKDPKDYQDPQALRNRLKSDTPQFDVEGRTSAAVKGLGKHVEVLKRSGILTVEDITRRDDYDQTKNNAVTLYERAESQMIDSYMVNPDDAASVLVDFAKTVPDTEEVYGFTMSEEEAAKDPSKILLKQTDNSGRLIPQLSKEQEAVAKKVLKDQIRIKLDYKETPTPIFQPRAASASTTKQQEGTRATGDFITKVTPLYTGQGGQKAVDDAIGYLKGFNIKGRGYPTEIIRTGSGLQFRFSDNPNQAEELDFVDANGQPLTQRGVIENISNLVFGTRDVDKALEQARNYNPDLPLDRGTTAESKNVTIVQPATKEKLQIGKDEMPVVDHIKKKAGGTITQKADIDNFVANTKDILGRFPNEEFAQSITYKRKKGADSKGKNIEYLVINIPSIDKNYTIPIYKESANNKAERIRIITKIWNEMAAESSKGTVGKTQSTTTATTSQVSQAAEGDALFN
jgi:hypothetical protein